MPSTCVAAGISSGLSTLHTKDIKAVVIETFGSGNATTQEWFIDCLKNALDRGLILLNITQCNAGSVIMGRYETSTKLLNLGVVSGNDMTTEAALTKLMFLLGQDLRKQEIAFYLNHSIAGEMSENIFSEG